MTIGKAMALRMCDRSGEDNAGLSDQPTFLGEPPSSPAAARLYEADREADGYVANLTRLWAWRPDIHESFIELRTNLTSSASLTERDRAVLVIGTAAERSDSYCALAWGLRLARLTDEETAAQTLTGNPSAVLSEREQVLADWARRVVRDPNAITPSHIDRLREVGLTDREIFDATVFVAFRLAFSTVNDALGAAPDKQLADDAPATVRAVVSWGRAPTPTPSPP